MPQIAYPVKNILESLGFAYTWNNQALDNLTFHEIKQRLFDQANQDLIGSINTSTKLQSYCILKKTLNWNHILTLLK